MDTGSRRTAGVVQDMEVRKATDVGQGMEAWKAADIGQGREVPGTAGTGQHMEGKTGEDSRRFGADPGAGATEDGLEEAREFVCIGCPLGCNVTARIREGEILDITGNTCPRGADYVTKELTDPRRIVTSLVRVRGGVLPVVSVKTAADIPKGRIMDCIRVLKGIELQAPVRIGDVVTEDVCGTEVKVVATGKCERNEDFLRPEKGDVYTPSSNLT